MLLLMTIVCLALFCRMANNADLSRTAYILVLSISGFCFAFLIYTIIHSLISLINIEMFYLINYIDIACSVDATYEYFGADAEPMMQEVRLTDEEIKKLADFWHVDYSKLVGRGLKK